MIPADYSTQLTYLLRYPSSATTTSAPPIHPCTLLLRQALTLQMSPTVAMGASVTQENFNLLNIPIEVPKAPPPTMRRRPANKNQSDSTSEAGPSNRGPTTPDGNKMHFRHGSASMGIPEMIARGLLERGESLGINKTVMNAVSELKVCKSFPWYHVAHSKRDCSVIYPIWQTRYSVYRRRWLLMHLPMLRIRLWTKSLRRSDHPGSREHGLRWRRT